MSQIKIIDNLQDETLDYQIEDLQDGYFDLFFSFYDATQPVKFNNLSFGFKLYNGDTLVAEEDWPKEGIKYISSDQDYLEVARVITELDTEYSLYVYAINGGNLIENNIHF